MSEQSESQGGAAAPGLQSFQFDQDAIGAIQNSVNLFRGDVGFTESLLTLTGRNGLDVKVNVLYQSNVQEQVDRDNLAAPTGIVGLGWSLPYERIGVAPTNSYAREAGAYFVVSGDSQMPLARTEVTAVLFQLPSALRGQLAAGTVTNGVRAAFLEACQPLSGTAQVAVESDTSWLIADDANEVEYRVRDEAGALDVYDGGLAYETLDYQFWKVIYYPRYERWAVTREDGLMQSYGGGVASAGGVKSSAGDSIQWGVRWGNWVGATASTDGQEQYPVAWGLRRTANAWGDEISFDYEQVGQRVGSEQGLPYTKACYLSRITDTYGRTVDFIYRDKEPFEYQDPHKAAPDDTPDAYQDRYETRYLYAVQTSSPGGDQLSSIRLSYELKNVSEPNDQRLTKRYLTGITSYSATGLPLPGLRFDYNWSADPAAHRGAMTRITYPRGGTATFTYTRQELPRCARETALVNPWPGKGTPRVWFGPDYAVVVWYDDEANLMRLTVQSWVGCWCAWSWQPDGAADIPVQLDLDSLSVLASAEFFALTYRATGISSSTNNFLLFHKNDYLTGQWLAPYQKTLPYDAGLLRVVSGEQFAVLYNPGGDERRALCRLSWDEPTKTWTEADLLAAGGLCDATGGSTFEITAAQNYYLILCYDVFGSGGLRRNRLQLFYRDEFKQWHDGPVCHPSEIVLASTAAGSTFAQWAPAETFAAFAYVSEFYTSSCAYNVQIFQWDLDYGGISGVLSPQRYTLAASVLPWVSTVSVENSLVCSGPFLFRYNGLRWLEQSFQLDPNDSSQVYSWFAYGPDLALWTRSNQATATAQAQYELFVPEADSGAWVTRPRPMPLDEREPNFPLQHYPTAAVNYVTLGRELFYRGAGWNQPPEAPAITNPVATFQGNLDTRATENRGPGFALVLDCDADGTPVGASAALLLNGQVRSVEPLHNGQGGEGSGRAVYFQLIAEVVKALQTGGSPQLDGKQPAGALAFVTYPAGETFRSASELTLHACVQQGVTGALVDYAVTGLSIFDGYDENQTFYVYDLESALFAPGGTVAKYYRVSVYPGSRDGSHGYTANTYFNGLSPSLASPPVPDPQNYTLLDGYLASVAVYDGAGSQVALTTNTWRVFQTRAIGGRVFDLNLGYVRQEGQLNTRDGVSQQITYEYDQTVGIISRQDTENLDAAGRAQTVSEIRTYLYRGYPEAIGLNVLVPVIQTRNEVGGTLTELQATAWAKWPRSLPDGDTVKVYGELASYRLQEWTADPEFNFQDWSGGGRPPAAWSRQAEINLRDAHGLVVEATDGSGLLQSYLYDEVGNNAVAMFANASLSGQEAGYLGFESYEQAGGWDFGAGASVVRGNAHTGLCSLKLNPGTASGLSRRFTPRRPDQPFLVSFWAKTGPGFAADSGQAGLTVTVAPSAGTPVAHQIAVGDSGGGWDYYSFKIDAPAGAGAGLSISLDAFNQKTSAFVLLDDLRFSPLLTQFSAKVYDEWVPDNVAMVGPNQETVRYVFGGFRQRVAVTGPDDGVNGLTESGSSRLGAGDFEPLNPNSSLIIEPRAGGPYFNFANAPEWQDSWSSDQPQKWSVQDGALVYAGGGASWIELASPEITRRYGLRFHVSPVAGPALFTLPESEAASLDEALVSDATREAFAAHGITLSQGALVAIARVNALWYVRDPGTPLSFRIENAGANLTVAEIGVIDQPLSVSVGSSIQVLWNPATSAFELYEQGRLRESAPRPSMNVNNWLAAAVGNIFLFYGNGRRVFAYVAGGDLEGKPRISASNRVELDNLVVFTDPLIGVDYTDGAGRMRQRQTLSEAGSIINAVLYDDLGHPVVQTKAALLAPDASHPLLAYRENFAVMDWADGTMSGELSDYYGPGGGGYSDDQGYPFNRKVHEASPLCRVIAQGVPGQAFAVNARGHYIKVAYSANTAQDFVALPAGEYFVRTVTDQNGVAGSTITDKVGQVVAEGENLGRADSAITTYETVYSFSEQEAGATRTTYPPLWHRPRAGEQPSPASLSVSRWNLLGQLVSKSGPDAGTTDANAPFRYLYTPSGLPRFLQDPAGAAARPPYVIYRTYDALSRIVEEGLIDYEWDATTEPVLKQCAAQNAALPPGTAPRPYRTYLYDVDPARPEANPDPSFIGNLCAVRVYDLDQPGELQTEEFFRYSVLGDVSAQTTNVSGYSTDTVGYCYDHAGNLLGVDYPGGLAAPRYSYDLAGRLAAIGSSSDPDAYASYAYTGDGHISQSTLNSGGGAPVTRSYGYNSPGWTTSVQDDWYGETIEYDGGGHGGAAYYDGRAARISESFKRLEQPGDFPTSYAYAFEYGGLGQLLVAENLQGGKVNPAWSLGLQDASEYDANGNALALERGASDFSFDRQPNWDQLTSLTGGAGQTAVSYNLNGGVSAVSGRYRGITYHPVTLLTSSMTLDGGGSLGFLYSGSGQRVLKAFGGDYRCYVRGLNDYPLVERARNGSREETTVYVYGLDGLILMSKGGAEHVVLKDRQGSIRALVEATRGVTSSAYAYSPFGGFPVAPYGDAALIAYLFTGQELDSESGLYNYRARMYDPVMVCFYALDPEGQFPSPYIFVGDDPVDITDPTGELAWFVVLILVGAVVGAASNVAFQAATGNINSVGDFFMYAAIGGAVGALGGALGAVGAEAALLAGTGIVANTLAGAATGAAVGAAEGALTGGFNNAWKEKDWGAFGSGAAEGAKWGAVLGAATGGALGAGSSGLAKLAARGAPISNQMIRHVFAGEVKPMRGGGVRATGYHYRGGIISRLRGSVSNLAPTRQAGVYSSNQVRVLGRSGYARKAFSSFFPESWSPYKVLSSVSDAFQNRVQGRIPGRPANYWEGTTASGMTIGGYLNNTGGIITAYPL